MSYFFYIPPSGGGGGGGGGGIPTPATTAKSIDNLFTAGENIAAFKFVVLNSAGKMIVADIYDKSVRGRIIGITTAAVAADVQGTVRQFGPISNPAWTLDLVAGDILLGENGDPLQGEPPVGTFIYKLGVSLGVTTFMVDIDHTIDI